MQKQKQKSDFAQEQSAEELKIKPLGISPPDVHATMDLLMSAEEKERGRRSKVAICVCGSRGCAIGPMREAEV